MPATASSSTTNPPFAARPSSPARSPAPWPASPLGLQNCLYLGNLDSLRDWGHARDYVEMQWLMLQQEQPEDFVIATGVQYSVRQMVEESAKVVGIRLRWEGEGKEEVGIVESVDAHGGKTEGGGTGHVRKGRRDCPSRSALLSADRG